VQVDLFDLDSQQHLLRLQTESSRLRAIEFSPDDKFQGTSAWSGKGIVWNLESLEYELEQLGLGLQTPISSIEK
jgi:hypothetical protein